MLRTMVAHRDRDGLWEAYFLVNSSCTSAEIVEVCLDGAPAPTASFVGHFGLGVYEEACELAISDLDHEDEAMP